MAHKKKAKSKKTEEQEPPSGVVAEELASFWKNQITVTNGLPAANIWPLPEFKGKKIPTPAEIIEKWKDPNRTNELMNFRKVFLRGNIKKNTRNKIRKAQANHNSRSAANHG
jgi:hypothetical protein